MNVDVFKLKEGDEITATVIFGGKNRGYFIETVVDDDGIFVKYRMTKEKQSGGIYSVNAENIELGHA